MVTYYRRPGVYLEESLLVNPADVAGTTTVAAFVGVALKGPPNTPVLCESWSAYSQTFGGFDYIDPPDASSIDTKVLSYMPYAVYSFYQNGGRFAWIVRSVPSDPDFAGSPATQSVAGGNTSETNMVAFRVNASSAGAWGNTLSFSIKETALVTEPGQPNKDVFTLSVLAMNSQGQSEVVEAFSGLSMTGDVPGTKRVDVAINNPSTGAGSRYIRITDVNDAHTTIPTVGTPNPGDPIFLINGVDPYVSSENEMGDSAAVLSQIEGPLNLNICGYLEDAGTMDTDDAEASFKSFVVSPRTIFPDREDIMSYHDGCPPRGPSVPPSTYAGKMQNELKDNTGDSYTVSYGPWIMIPNPAPHRVGEIIAIPPGGAVLGVIARLDATIGVQRAPAGIIAGIANAVGVQTKFTDTELGDINQANINVIRPVVGAGMCIMGARTRKGYGPDKYVSGRRVLIAVKESLRRSTQYAIFENNDERLWSSLRITADNILRPLWERGGLRGVNQQQAYYVRCDASLNTPQIIASGAVLMEVGVALEYPAEFIIIKITQVNSADFITEANTSF
jgi:hypothetical protein